MTDKTAVEPTLAELTAQLQTAMKAADATTVIAVAAKIQKLQAAEEKAKADEIRARAKAEHDKKMAALNPIIDGIRDAIRKVLPSAVKTACATAGIERLILDIGGFDAENVTVGAKASGPGVPGASPKSSSPSNGVAGKGRNVFVAPDGSRYSTKELLETFGSELSNPDKALDPVGISHRAKALAEKKGFSIEKQESE